MIRRRRREEGGSGAELVPVWFAKVTVVEGLGWYVGLICTISNTNANPLADLL